MIPAYLLYEDQQMMDYKGHTIVTLHDKVDHDWSWVVKRGEYKTHAEMLREDGRFVGSGVSLPDRLAAWEAARKFVDELPAK